MIVQSIGIFGGGVMGETIIAGLLRAGRPPRDILVVERRPERCEELKRRHGVTIATAEQAAAADLLILVVKPNDIGGLLDEIGSHVSNKSLVVSLAAGVRTGRIEEKLPARTPVVRAMPNTPALVEEGMTVISPGSACDEGHLAMAEALLAAVGRVARVDEGHQDAVTAVSGSGPAYILLVVEAMVDAGIRLGLPIDVATDLTIQTVIGTAKLMRDTGTDPSELRRQVTSPGGTTAAALGVLEERELRGIFESAMRAAKARSEELGS